MDGFRRTVAFVGGLILVLFGFMDECPRVGAIIIGLLLMGVFTVEEAIGLIRSRRND